MTFEDFWQSDSALKLRHPAPVRAILSTLAQDSPTRFDLLFHAAFAHRIFAVMQREGKDAEGFVRMQQSFSEAVEKLRAALVKALSLGFADAVRYTELSQEGMKRLLELASDLAIVKQWQVQNGLTDRAPDTQ